jgi:flagellin-like hook-associated protein FlgL
VASNADQTVSLTYDDATAADDNFFSIDTKTGVVTSNQAIDYTTPTAATDVAHLAAAVLNNFSFIVRYTDRDSNVHNERINLTIKKATETQLDDIEVETSAKATRAIETLNKALEEVSTAQAKLGAIQNRLTHNIDNLSKGSMLTEQSVGRIVDADFATETSELSKQQILAQAATSMLAQANQSKQSVLALLQ